MSKQGESMSIEEYRHTNGTGYGIHGAAGAPVVNLMTADVYWETNGQGYNSAESEASQ